MGSIPSAGSDHLEGGSGPAVCQAGAVAGHGAGGGHVRGVPAPHAAGHWEGHPQSTAGGVRQGGRRGRRAEGVGHTYFEYGLPLARKRCDTHNLGTS